MAGTDVPDTSASLLGCFPAELQNAIVAKAVESNTVYNSTSEDDVETTYDKLWLFSYKELFGFTSSNALQYEGTQYARTAGYSTAAASDCYDESGSVAFWWLRSPYMLGATSVYFVSSDGRVGGASVYTGYGLAPGFVLGNETEINKTTYAFAVYSTDDNSLRFYKSSDVPSEGGTYNGLTVTAVYTGIESITCSSETEVPWYSYRGSITSVTVEDEISPVSTAYWFCWMYQCTEMDLDNLDTSGVTDMNAMFYGCSSLTELDLGGFNTSNVTDMGLMFGYCSSLTELDVSGFNTSNVTDMGYMFGYCSSLTELDLGSFNTSNVTDMYYMFCGCTSLTELNLTGFGTSNVENMMYMFYKCTSLTELDLTGFDTSSVVNMMYMFANCSNLTVIYVSSSTWTTPSRSSNMFKSCGTNALTYI